MTKPIKYKFQSDGFECYASSSEEAKMKHKAFKEEKVVASFEEKKEAFEANIEKLYDAVHHIEEEANKSVIAIDVVKKETFSKDIVRNYAREFKKYVEESDIKNIIEDVKQSFLSATKTFSLEEWKEQCLAMLPDKISVGEHRDIEKVLEDICR